MPPKRPLKRRSEDEDRKQTKRTGKNKREQTYDTYDEALDGGVEMEEKGERYRDGEKVRQNHGQDKRARSDRVQAQRFYERAVELYAKASEFKETYDATYNRQVENYPSMRSTLMVYMTVPELSTLLPPAFSSLPLPFLSCASPSLFTNMPPLLAILPSCSWTSLSTLPRRLPLWPTSWTTYGLQTMPRRMKRF